MSGTFSAQDVRRARELRGVGWTYRRIAQLMTAEKGRPVHAPTVRLWCDDDAAARHRAVDRAGHLRSSAAAGYMTAINGRRSRGWKEQRMRALRAAGVPFKHIAAVMSVDFPDDDPLSRHQVAYLLRPTQAEETA